MQSQNNSAPNLVAMTKSERRAWLMEKALADGESLQQAYRLSRQIDEWISARGVNGASAHGNGVNLIISAVCEAAGVERHALLGQARTAEIASIRQLVMHMARELTGASTTQIGLRMHRDHTTVLHGARAAQQRLEMDLTYQALRDEALEILHQIQTHPLVDNPVTNGEKSDEAKVTRLYAER